MLIAQVPVSYTHLDVYKRQMATLPTTLNPTKNTILRVARELNRQVELVDALVDGGFGLDLSLIHISGGPGNSSEVLSTYLYRPAFHANQMGYASSIAITLS